MNIKHVSFGRDESSPVQPIVTAPVVEAETVTETFPETASPEGQDVAPTLDVVIDESVAADPVTEPVVEAPVVPGV